MIRKATASSTRMTAFTGRHNEELTLVTDGNSVSVGTVKNTQMFRCNVRFKRQLNNIRYVTTVFHQHWTI